MYKKHTYIRLTTRRAAHSKTAYSKVSPSRRLFVNVYFFRFIPPVVFLRPVWADRPRVVGLHKLPRPTSHVACLAASISFLKDELFAHTPNSRSAPNRAPALVPKRAKQVQDNPMRLISHQPGVPRQERSSSNQTTYTGYKCFGSLGCRESAVSNWDTSGRGCSRAVAAAVQHWTEAPDTEPVESR